MLDKFYMNHWHMFSATPTNLAFLSQFMELAQSHMATANSADESGAEATNAGTAEMAPPKPVNHRQQRVNRAVIKEVPKVIPESFELECFRNDPTKVWQTNHIYL